MRINCLGCGHMVDLDDAYDDYGGSVKCFACRAILEISTEQGCIKSVKQANVGWRSSAPEIIERVLNPTSESAHGSVRHRRAG
jgi:hypothetical protein